LPELTLAVGQDEEPLSFVRRPNFCRRKESRLNLVTQVSKVSPYLFKTKPKVSSHVLKEAEPG
tara:strand:+ start:408 stop:596 length:189 start_codon:yes stop_codon:yes gene_type:complete